MTVIRMVRLSLTQPMIEQQWEPATSTTPTPSPEDATTPTPDFITIVIGITMRTWEGLFRGIQLGTQMVLMFINMFQVILKSILIPKAE